MGVEIMQVTVRVKGRIRAMGGDHEGVRLRHRVRSWMRVRAAIGGAFSVVTMSDVSTLYTSSLYLRIRVRVRVRVRFGVGVGVRARVPEDTVNSTVGCDKPVTLGIVEPNLG